MRRLILAGLLAVTAAAAWAEEVKIVPPPPGSVTLDEGLAAWERIYAVVSHPRCSNCHVGASERPMWSGPSYGKTRVHGMNIQAGESRIGAEYVPCRTCHVTNQTGGNDRAHGAPQVADAWQLAPVEADWFGKSSDEICTQLRDPDLNGNRDFTELAEHLGHDVILHWAWAPGGTREPAPFSLQEHTDDMLTWGVAGMPCKSDQ